MKKIFLILCAVSVLSACTTTGSSSGDLAITDGGGLNRTDQERRQEQRKVVLAKEAELAGMVNAQAALDTLDANLTTNLATVKKKKALVSQKIADFTVDKLRLERESTGLESGIDRVGIVSTDLNQAVEAKQFEITGANTAIRQKNDTFPSGEIFVVDGVVQEVPVNENGYQDTYEYWVQQVDAETKLNSRYSKKKTK